MSKCFADLCLDLLVRSRTLYENQGRLQTGVLPLSRRNILPQPIILCYLAGLTKIGQTFESDESEFIINTPAFCFVIIRSFLIK